MRPHLFGLVLLNLALAEVNDTHSARTIPGVSIPRQTFGLFPPTCDIGEEPPIATIPPIVAPTPLPDPEELESFEEWKRRKEAELDDVPASSSVEAADNSSNSAPAQIPESESNSTIDTNTTVSAPPRTGKGHRYNYASPDCSSRVLASSPLTQHASSLLHKSRDRYMLTPCRADEHWVVIELCDEIRVEAIELAVWEFFSGIVRGVVVSVADEASGQEWTKVGEFVGKNVRSAQTFDLPEPTSFHRFLRLDFPSFYGTEYYCPVSQLKVYGMNQMEAFKMEQRRAAEASGAKRQEREEEREQRERDKEKEREAERQKEKERENAEAVAREKEEREDDARREKELCELEKLVQAQARLANSQIVLEPLTECGPFEIKSTSPPELAEVTASNGNQSIPVSVNASAQSPTNGSDSTNASASTSSSSAYAAPSGPRTDSSESIYAFIIRRLNALEGNSTLVARYIDEQAKALRTALTRAEVRWETSKILSAKEDERRWEAERMRQEDRLGRMITQMEAMRSSMESDRRITESQLRVLTSELGFERRRSLAQLIVLIAVIILGVLSRGDTIDALLRTLAVEGRRARARQAPDHVLGRNQKRLSTGPLAGILIDVADPGSSDNATYASSPTVRSPLTPGHPYARTRLSQSLKSPRRPSTPGSVVRRRVTLNVRSTSAEPSSLLDFEDDMSQPIRSVAAAAQRRRLARSAHLHPIRRRGDESSEAESIVRNMTFSAPSTPDIRDQRAVRPTPPRGFPTPSPAAAAAAVAAIKSGATVAPEDDSPWVTEGGSASSGSASEVEDEMPVERVGSRLLAKFAELDGKGGRDDERAVTPTLRVGGLGGNGRENGRENSRENGGEHGEREEEGKRVYYE